MLKRYIFVFIGAFLLAGPYIYIGWNYIGEINTGYTAFFAVSGAAIALAIGKKLNIVPEAHETNKISTIFTDEKGQKR